MRLVGSFPAVYYTLVLSIRQLPTNFSAITALVCKGPQPSLACDADPEVNFSLAGMAATNLRPKRMCRVLERR